MPTARSQRTLCPVSRATLIFGDRWSMLVVRELSFGPGRFQDIQAHTGATPQMLASRLKALANDGIVESRIYSRRPIRREYKLTAKGRDLLPVLFALRNWGEQWCKRQSEALALVTTHRRCGGDVGLDGVCASCKRNVAFSDLVVRPSPEYAEERRRAAQL